MQQLMIFFEIIVSCWIVFNYDILYNMSKTHTYIYIYINGHPTPDGIIFEKII